MQAFVNGRHRRFGRAGSVGVLDPQQHLTAVMFGEQPIEKRCASPANVQKTSRGGRKSRNNRHVNCFQRVSLRSGVALFITSFSHRPTASPARYFLAEREWRPLWLTALLGGGMAPNFALAV